eukprot:763075-Hanusia_phi.AAC.2
MTDLWPLRQFTASSVMETSTRGGGGGGEKEYVKFLIQHFGRPLPPAPDQPQQLLLLLRRSYSSSSTLSRSKSTSSEEKSRRGWESRLFFLLLGLSRADRPESKYEKTVECPQCARMSRGSEDGTTRTRLEETEKHQKEDAERELMDSSQRQDGGQEEEEESGEDKGGTRRAEGTEEME